VQISSHTCKIAFLGALLACALVAQPAGAASSSTTCQAPPGTSAIDQYCEALPAPGGNSGHHKKHSHPVSNSTTKALEKQGAAGKAVLNLVGSSGDAGTSAPTVPATPAPVKHKAVKRHRHHKQQASAPSSNPPATTNVKPVSHALPAPASNPVSAVGSAIGTGSSTGAVLLWLLVALAVVMGGTALIGYRRRARES
jgi:hypothetical protein